MSRDELVAQMMKAYFEVRSCNTTDAMTAALRVAADVLLGEPTTVERAHFRADIEINRTKFPERLQDRLLYNFLASRRVELERKKTPEERVTIERMIERMDGCYHVYLDGKWQESFSGERNAERYARGLRAELAEAK